MNKLSFLKYLFSSPLISIFFRLCKFKLQKGTLALFLNLSFLIIFWLISLVIINSFIFFWLNLNLLICLFMTKFLKFLSKFLFVWNILSEIILLIIRLYSLKLLFFTLLLLLIIENDFILFIIALLELFIFTNKFCFEIPLLSSFFTFNISTFIFRLIIKSLFLFLL